MFTLLFIIMMLVVFGKLIGLAVRATWGITKIIFSVVLLPIVLIVLVVMGLMWIAFPILFVIGIVSFIASRE